VFLAPFLITSTARATSMILPSDTELILYARVIITGEVLSVSTARDEAGEMWTYVEIELGRTLKGPVAGGHLVLKQLGGWDGTEGLQVFGQPRFSPGQRVLLYLDTAADGSLHVAHGLAGAFIVSTDAMTGRAVVTRNDPGGEVTLLPRSIGEAGTNRAFADQYIELIEETLERNWSEVAHIEAARSNQPIRPVPIEFERIRREPVAIWPSFALLAGGVRWMEADRGLAVRFYVNPENSPVVGGPAAELSRAMRAWSAQSGANILLDTAGTTSSCGLTVDNQNTISFGDCRNQLDPPYGCSGVVAQTTIRYTSETQQVGGRTFRRLIEADTVFNKGMECFLGTSANLAEVACHELGHSIGLDHTPDPAAIMFAMSHGSGFDARLGEDDKAGVLAIYPGAGGPPSGVGDDASFEGQSVTASMRAGETYSVLITMRNSGNTTWSHAAGYRLGSMNPQDNTNWGINRVNLPSPVYPGSVVTFFFDVTAPARPGVYNFQWRLLREGGEHFGTASVNVPVSVTGSGGATLVPYVERVKIKGSKKLFVYGDNFTPWSVIVLNGLALAPELRLRDGGRAVLFFKGRLELRPAGSNQLQVMNGDYRSVPFFF
jgi:hypothetical protein